MDRAELEESAERLNKGYNEELIAKEEALRGKRDLKEEFEKSEDRHRRALRHRIGYATSDVSFLEENARERIEHMQGMCNREEIYFTDDIKSERYQLIESLKRYSTSVRKLLDDSLKNTK